MINLERQPFMFSPCASWQTASSGGRWQCDRRTGRRSAPYRASAAARFRSRCGRIELGED
jgi:hypothetical protein